jgi:hypothetical protein
VDADLIPDADLSLSYAYVMNKTRSSSFTSFTESEYCPAIKSFLSKICLKRAERNLIRNLIRNSERIKGYDVHCMI